MASVFGVAQRTISRWERGEDTPGLDQQKRLRDLGWEPTGLLLKALAAAIRHCPAPRALCRTQNLRLQALSGPAIAKRPSVANWIGRDLAPIGAGGDVGGQASAARHRQS
jgi:transcriptional regulator with XRE-family HTH domain